MPLTRDVYRILIKEDLEWLETIPRTLERDHIISIVKASEDHEYGAHSLAHELTSTKLKLASAEASVKELEGLSIRIHSADESDVEVIVSIDQSRFVGNETPETLGDAMPRKEEYDPRPSPPHFRPARRRESPAQGPIHTSATHSPFSPAEVMGLTAKQLRSLGYLRLDRARDASPVPEVRYIITNGRGRVESATPCVLDDGKTESIA